MHLICIGCQKSVEPITVFERSPDSNKEWRITRCPREACKFNLDIEQYKAIKYPKGEKGGGRYFWDGNFWR